ncbi:MAG TPA: acetyltransferase [Pyrinomonadaceae bacterium]|jgi:sugar O-acyltransferase (sialic acid O-acetyltransferase NeuD family)|nr:acetyltransferase [Pyrinomonadaceae bacterium]
MAKVIIFGVQDFAQLAKFYLQQDSDHEVVGFSVNQQYLPEGKTFEGLPVVAFEDVEKTHTVSEFKFFAPMSPSRMNRLRESVYKQIKAKGYEMISYVSSRATVFSGALIGDNCFILEDNTIQPYTSIGNNVVLWSGNHIGHHSVIKDHVSFTSHVVLSGHCVVEPFSFFGVNATIRDRVHIAEGSLIAMAAAVTRDTEPWGVYKGNPATKGQTLSKDLDF